MSLLSGCILATLVKMSAIVKDLRERGNTVLMVEQSTAMLAVSDRVIELGPSGGAEGGKVIADGKPGIFIGAKEQAAYRGGKKRVLSPGLEVCGLLPIISTRVDVEIGRGGLIAVTGVSGSGKTALLKR